MKNLILIIFLYLFSISSFSAIQFNGSFGLNGPQDIAIKDDQNEYQLVLPDFAGELLINFKYIQLGAGSKVISSSSVEVETQNGNNSQVETIESSFDFSVHSYYGILSILLSQREIDGPLAKLINLKTFIYLRGTYGFDNNLKTSLGEIGNVYETENLELTTASLWMGLSFGLFQFGIDVGQRWLRIKELTEVKSVQLKELSKLDTPYINFFFGLEF
ncbi:MAG: hypothetical protein KDD58_04465 [Bdellovibrionales bacterium]|nr:hypothetical protein [Bdellovibrionales bacterium]